MLGRDLPRWHSRATPTRESDDRGATAPSPRCSHRLFGTCRVNQLLARERRDDRRRPMSLGTCRWVQRRGWGRRLVAAAESCRAAPAYFSAGATPMTARPNPVVCYIAACDRGCRVPGC